MGVNRLKKEEKTMNTKSLQPLMEEESSPIRAIFCLKKECDLSKIEEIDDCFILDFDPYLSIVASPLNHRLHDTDDDLSFVAFKGQVACRDYPHPRHLCVKFPFENTPHQTHCNMARVFQKQPLVIVTSWRASLQVNTMKGEGCVHPAPRTLHRQEPLKHWCYCYVCDSAAPCQEWSKGGEMNHCDADPNERTITRRLRSSSRHS